MPYAFLIAETPGDGRSIALATLIIFATAKVLEELFERLSLPGIAGQIAAGILIGPSVLGWIAPGIYTSTMAGLGVIFLLFGVGLEMEVDELPKVGGTAVVTGILGVLLPFLGGWGVAAWWGKPGLEAVFVGSALTATSVGITSSMLSARGLLNSTSSQIILAAAVVNDIIALLLLGVITSVAEQTVDITKLVITLGIALLCIALVARWGRDAMNRVIGTLKGRFHVGDGEFSVAMVVLFGLAAASVQLGVAAILGALLAGMALATAVPERVHDLNHGVTELMVPFFLADVGLHLQLDVFQDPSVLWLALVLLPVAIGSKLLACAAGAVRHGSKVALRVGLGMVPRGEFCVVVAHVGFGLKAISVSTYGIIVFLALATAILAPPLLKRAFRETKPHAVMQGA